MYSDGKRYRQSDLFDPWYWNFMDTGIRDLIKNKLCFPAENLIFDKHTVRKYA